MRASSASSASVNSVSAGPGAGSAAASRAATTSRYIAGGSPAAASGAPPPVHASNVPSPAPSRHSAEPNQRRWRCQRRAAKCAASSASSSPRGGSCRWCGLRYPRACEYSTGSGADSTSTPAGVSTRASSASISGCSARDRCSIVSKDTTTSTLASASGSAAADARTKRRFARPPYAARACATASGATSTPVTCAATSASSALPYPSPQDTSSTRRPAANRRANA